MMLPFSDELISAYLDGELTAQERQYVEEQLRENADLRRMCDELRSLRLTLQAMPVATPPENLAERVLRQAERRMLRGHERDADTCQEAGQASAVPSAAADYSGRHWRLAVALVVTLAACVLAAVGLPWFAGRSIVQAPESAMDQVGQALHNYHDVYKTFPVPDAMSDSAVTESTGVAAASVVPPAAEPALPGIFVDGAATLERAKAAAAYGAPTQGELADQDSAAIDLRAEAAAPAAPATDAPVELKAKADLARDALTEPEPAGGTGGMSGMGGMRGMGSGMGGGMGGGAGGVPGSVPSGSMGSAGRPGRMPGTGQGAAEPGPAMGLPGMGRATDPEKSEQLQAGDATSERPMMLGAGATEFGVASSPVPQGPGGHSLHFSYEPHSNQQVIQRVTAQLNQGQMALVKLHVPESALVGSLDQLRSLRHGEWPTDGRGLDQAAGAALPSVEEQLGEEKETVSGALVTRLARELRRNLTESDQKLLVVSGSAEQIHQTLVNLAAQPGVAIESAAVGAAGKSDEQLPQPEPARKPRAGQEAGTASREADTRERLADKKQEGDFRPAQPPEADYSDPAADASGIRSRALETRQKGVAENMKMIYVFFRLVPETKLPAAAPAEKANDR